MNLPIPEIRAHSESISSCTEARPTSSISQTSPELLVLYKDRGISSPPLSGSSLSLKAGTPQGLMVGFQVLHGQGRGHGGDLGLYLHTSSSAMPESGWRLWGHVFPLHFRSSLSV